VYLIIAIQQRNFLIEREIIKKKVKYINKFIMHQFNCDISIHNKMKYFKIILILRLNLNL
jgi:hypothetical protein